MSALQQAAAEYLSLRRGLGYKLERDGKLLAQFLAWLEDQGQARITTSAALAWVRLPEQASPSWLGMRMRVVRDFAAYLHTLEPAHEVPPAGLVPGHARRAVPYLYTEAEITALMTQAGRLKTPIRQATIATLIGLLTATGMRIGEVVGLDDADLNASDGLLVIRNAKFGKQRQIPLHPSTIAALQAVLLQSRGEGRGGHRSVAIVDCWWCSGVGECFGHDHRVGVRSSVGEGAALALA